MLPPSGPSQPWHYHNDLVRYLIIGLPYQQGQQQGQGPCLSCQCLAQAGGTCGMDFWSRWLCPVGDWQELRHNPEIGIGD